MAEIPDSNPGHVGGRRVQSPLRHPCSQQNEIINEIEDYGVNLRTLLSRDMYSTGYLSLWRGGRLEEGGGCEKRLENEKKPSLRPISIKWSASAGDAVLHLF